MKLTCEQFVIWIKSFIKQYRMIEHKFNILYNEIGLDPIEFLANMSYETLMVNTIADILNDDREDYDDLTFFINDCDFSFEKFNKLVSVDDKSPNIKSYEDLYYFITERRINNG